MWGSILGWLGPGDGDRRWKPESAVEVKYEVWLPLGRAGFSPLAVLA